MRKWLSIYMALMILIQPTVPVYAMVSQPPVDQTTDSQVSTVEPTGELQPDSSPAPGSTTDTSSSDEFIMQDISLVDPNPTPTPTPMPSPSDSATPVIQNSAPPSANSETDLAATAEQNQDQVMNNPVAPEAPLVNDPENPLQVENLPSPYIHIAEPVTSAVMTYMGRKYPNETYVFRQAGILPDGRNIFILSTPGADPSDGQSGNWRVVLLDPAVGSLPEPDPGSPETATVLGVARDREVVRIEVPPPDGVQQPPAILIQEIIRDRIWFEDGNEQQNNQHTIYFPTFEHPEMYLANEILGTVSPEEIRRLNVLQEARTQQPPIDWTRIEPMLLRPDHEGGIDFPSLVQQGYIPSEHVVRLFERADEKWIDFITYLRGGGNGSGAEPPPDLSASYVEFLNSFNGYFVDVYDAGININLADDNLTLMTLIRRIRTRLEAARAAYNANAEPVLLERIRGMESTAANFLGNLTAFLVPYQTSQFELHEAAEGRCGNCVAIAISNYLLGTAAGLRSDVVDVTLMAGDEGELMHTPHAVNLLNFSASGPDQPKIQIFDAGFFPDPGHFTTPYPLVEVRNGNHHEFNSSNYFVTHSSEQNYSGLGPQRIVSWLHGWRASNLYTEAMSLKTAGREEEARSKFNEIIRLSNAAIALDPADASSYARKGNALNALEDYRSAVTALQTAVSLAPQVPGYDAMLVSAYARFEAPTNEELSQAARAAYRAAVLYDQVRQYDDVEGMLAILNMWVGYLKNRNVTAPFSAEEYYTASQIADRLDQGDIARDFLGRALDLDSEHIGALNDLRAMPPPTDQEELKRLARVYFQAAQDFHRVGNDSKAVLKLRAMEAMVNDLEDAEVAVAFSAEEYYAAGQLASRLDMRETAINFFLRALHLDSDPFSALALDEIRSMEPPNEEETLRRTAQELLSASKHLYNWAHDNQGAVDTLTSLLRVVERMEELGMTIPFSAEDYYAAGHMAFEQREWHLARNFLYRALALDEHHVGASNDFQDIPPPGSEEPTVDTASNTNNAAITDAPNFISFVSPTDSATPEPSNQPPCALCNGEVVPVPLTAGPGIEVFYDKGITFQVPGEPASTGIFTVVPSDDEREIFEYYFRNPDSANNSLATALPIQNGTKITFSSGIVEFLSVAGNGERATVKFTPASNEASQQVSGTDSTATDGSHQTPTPVDSGGDVAMFVNPVYGPAEEAGFIKISGPESVLKDGAIAFTTYLYSKVDGSTGEVWALLLPGPQFNIDEDKAFLNMRSEGDNNLDQTGQLLMFDNGPADNPYQARVFVNQPGIYNATLTVQQSGVTTKELKTQIVVQNPSGPKPSNSEPSNPQEPSEPEPGTEIVDNQQPANNNLPTPTPEDSASEPPPVVEPTTDPGSVPSFAPADSVTPEIEDSGMPPAPASDPSDDPTSESEPANTPDDEPSPELENSNEPSALDPGNSADENTNDVSDPIEQLPGIQTPSTEIVDNQPENNNLPTPTPGDSASEPPPVVEPTTDPGSTPSSVPPPPTQDLTTAAKIIPIIPSPRPSPSGSADPALLTALVQQPAPNRPALPDLLPAARRHEAAQIDLVYRFLNNNWNALRNATRNNQNNGNRNNFLMPVLNLGANNVDPRDYETFAAFQTEVRAQLGAIGGAAAGSTAEARVAQWIPQFMATFYTPEADYFDERGSSLRSAREAQPGLAAQQGSFRVANNRPRFFGGPAAASEFSALVLAGFGIRSIPIVPDLLQQAPAVVRQPPQPQQPQPTLVRLPNGQFVLRPMPPAGQQWVPLANGQLVLRPLPPQGQRYNQNGQLEQIPPPPPPPQRPGVRHPAVLAVLRDNSVVILDQLRSSRALDFELFNNLPENTAINPRQLLVNSVTGGANFDYRRTNLGLRRYENENVFKFFAIQRQITIAQSFLTLPQNTGPRRPIWETSQTPAGASERLNRYARAVRALNAAIEIEATFRLEIADGVMPVTNGAGANVRPENLRQYRAMIYVLMAEELYRKNPRTRDDYAQMAALLQGASENGGLRATYVTRTRLPNPQRPNTLQTTPATLSELLAVAEAGNGRNNLVPPIDLDRFIREPGAPAAPQPAAPPRQNPAAQQPAPAPVPPRDPEPAAAVMARFGQSRDALNPALDRVRAAGQFSTLAQVLIYFNGQNSRDILPTSPRGIISSRVGEIVRQIGDLEINPELTVPARDAWRRAVNSQAGIIEQNIVEVIHLAQEIQNNQNVLQQSTRADDRLFARSEIDRLGREMRALNGPLMAIRSASNEIRRLLETFPLPPPAQPQRRGELNVPDDPNPAFLANADPMPAVINPDLLAAAPAKFTFTAGLGPAAGSIRGNAQAQNFVNTFPTSLLSVPPSQTNLPEAGTVTRQNMTPLVSQSNDGTPPTTVAGAQAGVTEQMAGFKRDIERLTSVNMNPDPQQLALFFARLSNEALVQLMFEVASDPLALAVLEEERRRRNLNVREQPPQSSDPQGNDEQLQANEQFVQNLGLNPDLNFPETPAGNTVPQQTAAATSGDTQTS